MFNVQIQVSTSRSTATRASAFLEKSTELFYRKIFEHEADGEAFEWINVAPVASIIRDINIYQCHMIKRQWRCYFEWKSAFTASITEWLLLPNLMTVVPL